MPKVCATSDTAKWGLGSVRTLDDNPQLGERALGAVRGGMLGRVVLELVVQERGAGNEGSTRRRTVSGGGVRHATWLAIQQASASKQKEDVRHRNLTVPCPNIWTGELEAVAENGAGR